MLVNKKTLAILTIAFLSLITGIFLSMHYTFSGDLVKITKEYEKEVLQEIAYIKKHVEELRGLNVSKSIDVKFVNSRWAKENWGPKTDYIPEELVLKELFYKSTFLINWNDSIINLSQEWIGMFVAASVGYDLYINIDYFNPKSSYAKNVLAHEITHIAQHENFRIQWPKTTDSNKAISALIEGDAGLVQRLFCTRSGECEPSVPWTVDFNDLYLSFNAFPYIYGENFVSYLYEMGGWELVNKAYTKPPITTKMIMFPEEYIKYLHGYSDHPQNITSTINDAKMVDVMGAYYIYLISIKVLNPDDALQVAKSWKNDQLIILRESNVTTMIWRIELQDIDLASKFYEAQKRYIESILDMNEHCTIERCYYVLVMNNFNITYELLLKNEIIEIIINITE